MNFRVIAAADLADDDRIHAGGVNTLTVYSIVRNGGLIEMHADPAPSAAVWDLNMICHATGARSAEYLSGYTYLLRFGPNTKVRLVVEGRSGG